MLDLRFFLDLRFEEEDFQRVFVFIFFLRKNDFSTFRSPLLAPARATIRKRKDGRYLRIVTALLALPLGAFAADEV